MPLAIFKWNSFKPFVRCFLHSFSLLILQTSIQRVLDVCSIHNYRITVIGMLLCQMLQYSYMSSCALFSNVCCLNHSGLSEKDTMDVWCNGQKLETTVSYSLNHALGDSALYEELMHHYYCLSWIKTRCCRQSELNKYKYTYICRDIHVCCAFIGDTLLSLIIKSVHLYLESCTGGVYRWQYWDAFCSGEAWVLHKSLWRWEEKKWSNAHAACGWNEGHVMRKYLFHFCLLVSGGEGAERLLPGALLSPMLLKYLNKL